MRSPSPALPSGGLAPSSPCAANLIQKLLTLPATDSFGSRPNNTSFITSSAQIRTRHFLSCVEREIIYARNPKAVNGNGGGGVLVDTGISVLHHERRKGQIKRTNHEPYGRYSDTENVGGKGNSSSNRRHKSTATEGSRAPQKTDEHYGSNPRAQDFPRVRRRRRESRRGQRYYFLRR